MTTRMDNREIMVTVHVITYCHEKYIRQCLDGILMQKTNFRFEVLIGDDASKDNTQEILKEYDEKYPGFFTMILRKENIGATNNAYDLFQKAKGKYIAVLEGDDFWIDPNKLQIQYDFLENHPEFIGCVHDSYWVNEEGNRIEGLNHFLKDTFTLQQFDGSHFPADTITMFFRNIFKNPKHDYSIFYNGHDLLGDATVMLFLLLQGDIAYIDRCMGVHRRVVKKNGTNAVSILYHRKYILYEWFKYYRGLEKYAKKEFGKKIYLPRKEWQFETHIKKIFTEFKNWESVKYGLIMWFDSGHFFKYTKIVISLFFKGVKKLWKRDKK